MAMTAFVRGFKRGEPLVTKAAAVVKFVVLPGAMIAAFIYSPPDSKKP